MAKLIYSMLTSLDGYTEDEHGQFGWGAPEDASVCDTPSAGLEGPFPCPVDHLDQSRRRDLNPSGRFPLAIHSPFRMPRCGARRSDDTEAS